MGVRPALGEGTPSPGPLLSETEQGGAIGEEIGDRKPMKEKEPAPDGP